MSIKKQEFYEGAALHLLARTGEIASIGYQPPFFVVNEDILLLLKYSTKGRSPWAFTFTPAEQKLLGEKAASARVVLGLICGADGVAALAYDSYASVASCRSSAIHIACYRDYGEHYDVHGPDGKIEGKIAPAQWKRIFKSGASNDATS